MAESVILDKSFEFAKRIVKLYKYLIRKKVYILARQVLRSGTAIGANVTEAVGAQSRKDFVAKAFIALKEARETSYWLRLLHDSDYIEHEHFDSIHNDCHELIRLLSATVITTRKNDTQESENKAKQNET
jgi:four helix bundle protein